jgi:hypothetical protein
MCKKVCTLGGLPAAGSAVFFDKTTLHCYARVDSSQNFWSGAQTQCKDWGGDLFAFTTTQERDAVLAGLPGKGEAWCGGTDMMQMPGNFVWSDGETFPKPAPWAPGEPDDNATHQCVQIDSGGLLYNQDCTVLSNYLCERTIAAK